MKSLYQNKDILELAKVASKELDIPIYLIMQTYKSYFDNIKQNMAKQVLNDLNKDYTGFSMSFNLQGIGKMYTDGDLINKVNAKKIIKQNRINEENKLN